MPSDTPLNLAEVDPPIWYVMAGEDVYGPYTMGQMRALAEEGRVIARSPVSKGADGPFAPAHTFETLRPLFPDLPEQDDEPLETGACNFVIIARSTSGDPTTVTHAVARTLDGFGAFAETLPGIFILNADHRLADIRKALDAALNDAPDAQILIVEAPNGRLGWLGLPIELDQHIRSIWRSQSSGNKTQ